MWTAHLSSWNTGHSLGNTVYTIGWRLKMVGQTTDIILLLFAQSWMTTNGCDIAPQNITYPKLWWYRYTWVFVSNVIWNAPFLCFLATIHSKTFCLSCAWQIMFFLIRYSRNSGHFDYWCSGNSGTHSHSDFLIETLEVTYKGLFTPQYISQRIAITAPFELMCDYSRLLGFALYHLWTGVYDGFRALLINWCLYYFAQLL